MLLNKEYAFGIILPHHTASRSVYEALKGIPGTEDIQPHHLSDISLFEKFPNFFWASTTRHPFSRVLTSWHHCRNWGVARSVTKPGSERWLKTKRAFEWGFGKFTSYYLQVENFPTLISDVTSGHRIDLFLNAETLVADFKKLPSRILSQALPLAHYNKHKKVVGMYQLFPETVPIIINKFQQDFEQFGYSKDPEGVEAGKIFVTN